MKLGSLNFKFIIQIVPYRKATLYVEFSIKIKRQKLGKNCERYEDSNQASHRLCAEVLHWLTRTEVKPTA